jgi:hypothetical protein
VETQSCSENYGLFALKRKEVYTSTTLFRIFTLFFSLRRPEMHTPQDFVNRILVPPQFGRKQVQKTSTEGVTFWVRVSILAISAIPKGHSCPSSHTSNMCCWRVRGILVDVLQHRIREDLR